ncbi:MAG: dienelactone hydrolase family protein [Steroidobacteraceae bacterium]
MTTTTTRAVRYEHDGEPLHGALVRPTADGTVPCVMVVPAWEGRSQAQEVTATDLARLGYAAFCVDVYGGGKCGSTPAECEALMTPFIVDRALLRARLLAAVATVRALPQIDPDRVAAIGFCFGGLCVLDLARANAPLAAIASIHGLFTPLPPPLTTATRIDAKVIAFHGWDDPMVPPKDVEALGRELSAARAQWQLHVFGGTMHAFTNKDANAPELGIQYDSLAAARTWVALGEFLRETV